eukprot:scaffold136660_cov30-Tisochrysis_lutea.AAC.1
MGIPAIDMAEEAAVSTGALMAHKDLGDCKITHTSTGTMYANTHHVQIEYFLHGAAQDGGAL